MLNPTLQGFSPICRLSVAGFQRVWAARRYRNVMSISTVQDDFITYVDPALEWIELPVNQQGSLTDNFGGGTYQQLLSFEVIGVRAERQRYARLLATGRWAFVVLDNTGRYWGIGLVGDGANRTAIQGAVSKLGEQNLYKVSFVAESPYPMRGINDGSFFPIITGVCSAFDDELANADNGYGEYPLYPFADCLIDMDS